MSDVKKTGTGVEWRSLTEIENIKWIKKIMAKNVAERFKTKQKKNRTKKKKKKMKSDIEVIK